MLAGQLRHLLLDSQLVVLCASELNSDVQVRLERVTGIEPASSAWEADVLPLNYTRVSNLETLIGSLAMRRMYAPAE